MKVARLRAKSELQLPAYATATATPHPRSNHVYNLYHSSWQRWISYPLSEVRDWSHILMDTSQVLNPLSHNGNSHGYFLISHMSLRRIYIIFFMFDLSMPEKDMLKYPTMIVSFPLEFCSALYTHTHTHRQTDTHTHTHTHTHAIAWHACKFRNPYIFLVNFLFVNCDKSIPTNALSDIRQVT